MDRDGPHTISPAAAAAQRQHHANLKASWMRDKAWISRWLDGGTAEAKQFELLSVVLSSPVID